MKKLLTSLAATMLLLQVVYAQREKKETIEGNGKVVTRDVPVASFSSLQAGGVFQLKLSQGDKESVKLEGEENLLELIEVKNEGSKLIINTDKLKNKNVNIKSKRSMVVHVTYKKMNQMELNMIGNVHSATPLTFDNLDLKNSGIGNMEFMLRANAINLTNKGVGNVTLSGTAQKATISNTGVGSLQAGNFAVQTMDLKNSGIGSVEINAVKIIKVSSSGMGSVTNKGAAPLPKKKSTAVI